VVNAAVRGYTCFAADGLYDAMFGVLRSESIKLARTSSYICVRKSKWMLVIICGVSGWFWIFIRKIGEDKWRSIQIEKKKMITAGL